MWLEALNTKGYAGYHEWRLPTVEESASLDEPGKKNGGLYIAPVFSNKQRWILTGDCLMPLSLVIDIREFFV